jgi:hypothetical protein
VICLQVREVVGHADRVYGFLCTRWHRDQCRADCCTRQMQHSTGQYDDLARVPRARPREGCYRRTTASRHRRRSPARCSRRVVPPIRDARLVDLNLAVFMCNSARGQERLCRAQRPGATVELKAPKQSQVRGRGNRSPPDHESTDQDTDRTVLHNPWRKTSPKRRREIIVPKSAAPQDALRIRAETRAKLVASIARGRAGAHESRDR